MKRGATGFACVLATATYNLTAPRYRCQARVGSELTVTDFLSWAPPRYRSALGRMKLTRPKLLNQDIHLPQTVKCKLVLVAEQAATGRGSMFTGELCS